MKNAKKQPEKLPLSKPGKILRQDPVTYISETGKDTGCVQCFRGKQCLLCSCASHWNLQIKVKVCRDMSNIKILFTCMGHYLRV